VQGVGQVAGLVLVPGQGRQDERGLRGVRVPRQGPGDVFDGLQPVGLEGDQQVGSDGPEVGELVPVKEARKVIEGAKQAILFLMFNPGSRDTLLNAIIQAARAGTAGKRLYIHGAINQDPSTSANPVLLFDRGNAEKADFEVVLPAAIDEPTKFFRRELKQLPGTFAMVHSKVVLVDPLGKHPVVLTGSHNLGPKASGTNDENLLIIRDAPGLAAAYAANVMAIYNQYRWRFRRQTQPVKKRWKGLKDTDTWQTGYLKPGSVPLREIDFWVGE
jgi:phosphatidylserine/phosphatidylglycerophosphate/cardiolipin synthase-like enzyme